MVEQPPRMRQFVQYCLNELEPSTSLTNLARLPLRLATVHCTARGGARVAIRECLFLGLHCRLQVPIDKSSLRPGAQPIRLT